MTKKAYDHDRLCCACMMHNSKLTHVREDKVCAL